MNIQTQAVRRPRRRPRYIGSKWIKTVALLRQPDLHPYVPETKVLSKQSLQVMLDRYGMVYVKPDHGTAGQGVMRTEKLSSDGRTLYKYQIRSQARTFASRDEMYNSMMRVRSRRSRRYLVQKGIRMLRYHGRPFDIRVMVQKNPQNQWEATGVIGRVAHPSRIVTNFHDRGTPTPISTLLSAGLTDRDARARFEAKLRSLGLAVAKQMERVFPGVREIGVDVALDEDYHPWVLEVNTRPDPYIFNRLRDKSMYRRVIACSRANGRL